MAQLTKPSPTHRGGQGRLLPPARRTPPTTVACTPLCHVLLAPRAYPCAWRRPVPVLIHSPPESSPSSSISVPSDNRTLAECRRRFHADTKPLSPPQVVYEVPLRRLLR